MEYNERLKVILGLSNDESEGTYIIDQSISNDEDFIYLLEFVFDKSESVIEKEVLGLLFLDHEDLKRTEFYLDNSQAVAKYTGNEYKDTRVKSIYNLPNAFKLVLGVKKRG